MVLNRVFRRIIYTLVIFISSPLFLYAQDDFWRRSSNKVGSGLEIHTWGYGDLVLRVLGGVSALINNSDTYYIVFGIFMLIGVCFLFFEYIRPAAARGMDPLKMARWWLWLAIIYALVFKAQTTVFVEEHSPYVAGKRMSLEAGIPMGDHWTTRVPWIIGYPLHVFTTLEYALSKEIEKYFYDDYSYRLGGEAPSNGIKVSYTESGFLSPLIALNEMGSGNASFDPYLYMNMNSYIIDCVVPEILSGRINMESLLSSNDLANIIFQVGSGGTINPARVTKYMEPASGGTFFKPTYETGGVSNVINRSKPFSYLSCGTAANNIMGKINELSNSGTNLLSLVSGVFDNNKSSNINSTISGMLSNEYSDFLGIAPEFLMGYKEGASQFFTQALIMNQFNEAYSTWAAMNGIPKDALSVGVTRAQIMAKERMSFSAVMAARYFPIVKGIIMVIVIGFTPVIILMLLTPMFTKFLMGYFMALLWLSLWHIGSALLHSVIMFISSNYLTGLTNGTYNMLYKYAVDSNVLDYINMAGKLYWSIPTIALMVAGGFSMYVMNSLAHTLSESVDGATGAAASETSVGNLSYGNISTNNMSGNKTNFARNFAMGSSFSAAFGNDVSFRANHDVSTTGNQDLTDGISGYGAVRALADGGKQIDNFTSDSLMKVSNGTMDASGRLQSGEVKAPTQGAAKELAQVTGSDNLNHLTQGKELDRVESASVSGGQIVKAVAYDTDGNKYVTEMSSDGAVHTAMVDKQTGDVISGVTEAKGVMNQKIDTDGDGNYDAVVTGGNVIKSVDGSYSIITGGVISSSNDYLNGMTVDSIKTGADGHVIQANASSLVVDPNTGQTTKLTYTGEKIDFSYTDTNAGKHSGTIDLASGAVILSTAAMTTSGFIDIGGGYQYSGKITTEGDVTKFSGVVMDQDGGKYDVTATAENGNIVHIQGKEGQNFRNEDIKEDLFRRFNEWLVDNKITLPSTAATGMVDPQAALAFMDLAKNINTDANAKPEQLREIANMYGAYLAGGIRKDMPVGLDETVGKGGSTKFSETKSKDEQTIGKGGAGLHLPSGLTGGVVSANIGLEAQKISKEGSSYVKDQSDQYSTQYKGDRTFTALHSAISDTIYNRLVDIQNNPNLRDNFTAANEYLGRSIAGTVAHTISDIRENKLNASEIGVGDTVINNEQANHVLKDQFKPNTDIFHNNTIGSNDNPIPNQANQFKNGTILDKVKQHTNNIASRNQAVEEIMQEEKKSVNINPQSSKGSERIPSGSTPNPSNSSYNRVVKENKR